MKTREEKQVIIDQITERLTDHSHVYIADISGLNAEDTHRLRKMCHEKEIFLMVCKNTLLKRALGSQEGKYEGIEEVLSGPTSIMLSNTGNLPAKLIKEFRKNNEKPLLKGAYVEESVYIGEENLDALSQIKSKEELIGDLVSLLQSPMKNVISSLQSGGNTLTGLLKTLSDKKE
jgi:large subunit ribosomal protein L10